MLSTRANLLSESLAGCRIFISPYMQMHIILDRIRCAVTRLSIINTSSHYTSYTHHKHSLKFDGHQDMHAQWSRIAWSGVEYNAAKDDLPEGRSSCIIILVMNIILASCPSATFCSLLLMQTLHGILYIFILSNRLCEPY